MLKVVKFVTSMYIEAKWKFLNHNPTLKEYMVNAKNSIAVGAIVQPTLFFLGEKISEEDFNHEDYSRILDPINTIGRLKNDVHGFKVILYKDKSSKLILTSLFSCIHDTYIF